MAYHLVLGCIVYMIGTTEMCKITWDMPGANWPWAEN